MTVSLIGVALTADGLSQGIEVAEDRWTVRTRSWAVSGVETRANQATRIPVNVGHDDDQELGEVVSLHRTDQGAVWALAVCDAGNANRLLGYRGQLFFSPKTWRNRDDGTDIEIEHLAVTESPATVSIPPLELYGGGLDRAGSWMHRGKVFDGIRRDLVEQARERSRWQNRSSPIRVGGHNPDDDYGPPPPSSYELMKMRGSHDLPGGLRKSGHLGRILRVR